eukprot:SAG31_NODE_4220_length_3449_cov_1.831940_4_plen_113_part_00
MFDARSWSDTVDKMVDFLRFVGPHFIMNATNTPTITPSDPETTRWANITYHEDPNVWLDAKGRFHVITHSYAPVQYIAPFRMADVVSAHGFSEDGGCKDVAFEVAAIHLSST